MVIQRSEDRRIACMDVVDQVGSESWASSTISLSTPHVDVSVASDSRYTETSLSETIAAEAPFET